ncbi:MAG: glycerophosphodiester phosphodiesterase family protein [Paracoccus sp. (in: a-proteobacteria)]|uniref:glycerophosphodiester phosphodiesterase family protein n=1 Tax=Paracoccus sp. TaxID=267 RepID=UPI0026DEB6FC|nr:glycerophosphodiester phosphodiesterase family protein [Paracoccus sp. (in: a-proteobacteria)]MDO5611633.1 glycerophosphodiester phosphodiesterase family protein [Paracoccus sp. (in: a-proteobacteria)]
MPAPLPTAFLDRPIAHRGLHGPGVPENSLAAARAAIAAGYGIELDIQPSASGQPLVFHDYDLDRLTGQPGFIRDRDGDDLAALRLTGSDEPVPTLPAFLELVAGRVPLLIEIKDQDMRLGPDIGALHQAVAAALAGYAGPVAVMSFNPHVVTGFHALAPQIACGLTTCGYTAGDWPMIDAARRAHLAAIADFDASGSGFVSHDHSDLDNPAVAALKARGVPVLCWTIRSKAQETAARRIADNITFEGYAA